ncbi:hypothetical protein CARUB_v10012211mg [Capsella rubella]|uniref:RING-type E3 ubiquitin transferase n=1 Tax=Capsella rubella TaxID=81985 RepID=R0IPW2_9BRAS|nr:RING-H2 finger protein ATL29 [Capsella rubella]EOA39233.1 hypothetical protein CARUB_v10012211mg [Capsella rubella]
MDTPQEFLIVFLIIGLIITIFSNCYSGTSPPPAGLVPPETIHQTPQPDEQDIETGRRQKKTLLYKDIKDKEGGEEEEKGGSKRFCPICLEEYEDDHEMRRLKKCGHVFHLLCIDSWLKRERTCPSCRRSVDLISLLS